MNGPWYPIVGVENLYQYNSKEWNSDLEWNDYGARMYDPIVGRFWVSDAYAEKYYPMTNYQYGANNPIKYIDINGDSINIAIMQLIDKNQKTNVANELVTQLSEITGLNLFTNKKGHINYHKDKNGSPIIKQKNGSNIGSLTARNDLISVIDNKTTINVTQRPGGKSVTESGGTNIGLDPIQIQDFVNGTLATNVLNEKTMGIGLVFMHELRHTGIGGSFRDPPSSNLTATGPVVDRVNIYRSELDANPANTGSLPYGQRDHYNASPTGYFGKSTLGFRYKKLNRRGRTVRRYTTISF